MRATVFAATALAVIAVVLFGPVLAAAAAALGLIASALHEAIHYVTAVAVGAQNVDLGWDAVGPYVAYDGAVRPVVHLAPPFAALVLAVWLTATTAFPDTSSSSVLVASFLIGLHSLSPTDYAPLYAK